MEVIPPFIVDMIILIPLDLLCKDKILFTLSSSGKFELKKVWDKFRSQQENSVIYSSLWHNNIPLSYSILAWRCIKGFIPVDTLIQKKGFSFPSKCYCCADIENVNHLFVNGAIAKKVWFHFSKFTNLYNMEHFNDLHSLLKEWMKNNRGHILNLIATLILWYIWKSRNEAKHCDINMDATLIIENINHKIRQLVHCNLITFKNCRKFNNLAMFFDIKVDDKSHNFGSRFVIWRKHSFPFVKLNSNGSVNQNSAGAGGILRDHRGMILAAYASPLSSSSVITAELTALSLGIEKCIILGFFNVWIELDAHIVVQIINNLVQGNPQDFYLIRKIKQHLSTINFTISHVYREANACADWLAKFGCQLEGFQNLDIYNLNPFLKGLINLDKTALPYIRHV